MKRVFKFLFTTTKGLILMAIALIAVVTAIWGTLSGPMVEWGAKDITVRLLGMELHPIERAGRIILLYHSIAMAVVAIEVYMITSIVPMEKRQQRTINGAVTAGYMLAMFGGLGLGAQSVKQHGTYCSDPGTSWLGEFVQIYAKM